MNKKTLSVSEKVEWIGVLDSGLVTFDVIMETQYGSTYNSYLLKTEKKTIVETVKESFYLDFKQKIEKHINLSEIEYIVVDHTEPDHSGSLKHLLKDAPQATVVASLSAIRYLRDLLGYDFKHIVVKDGDSLDLGDGVLKFISAPNLHWPDSIYTWFETDGVLFTCDSFGSHYCNENMFDDLIGDFEDAFKYYFDVILKPFSKFMLKAIEKIENLPIKSICTGHGPILRSNWKKYLELSKEYSKNTLEELNPKRVLITYVSAYHNTQVMADWIAQGVKSSDPSISVAIIDLENANWDAVSFELASSNAFIIGSPTINQNTLPQIYKLFSYVNPIRDKGKIGGAFGSFGWSGESAKIVKSSLENLKLNFFENGVFIKFTPHEEEFKRCFEYGLAIGNELINISK
ncbi:FprA family A-type flavoprotein [bacterium]|nr:FprA family A-type flavoprotein [bacterium]